MFGRVRIRRIGVAASHGLKENENSTLIRDSALVDGLRLSGAEGNLEGFDVVQQQFSLVFTADDGAAGAALAWTAGAEIQHDGVDVASASVRSPDRMTVHLLKSLSRF